MNTFIYALCEPGTRTVRYIGKTHNIKKRFRQHSKEGGKLKTHLGCWIRSLPSPPEMIIIREVSGDGSKAERRCIRLAKYFGMRLVNSTEGGDGVTMTPEIREKISAALSGKAFTPSHLFSMRAAAILRRGRAPHNKGIPMPESLKANLRLLVGERSAHFGRKRTTETRAKMSAAQTGRLASEEAKQNMSSAKQGEKNNRFGTRHTKETKMKMRLSALARNKKGAV